MHFLSVFDTSSDTGKSTLSFALIYLLHHRGVHVAPFKAQNVSNNSLVTDIDKGDISLFNEGVKIIEEDFGIKVLGVVPFKPFNLGFEDAASLMGYTQDTSKAIIKVGVIKLPHISNFTDFEPLFVNEEIDLSFITSPSEAALCDLLIIPGSKQVVDDLLWLCDHGFEPILTDKNRHIIAICGGYEMMFENILDEEQIESQSKLIKGLGRFKGSVAFQKEKIVQKGCYNQQGIMVTGYEIHNATAKKRSKKKKKLYGTFLHGIFENDAFRYKVFHTINKNYKGYNFKKI